MTEQAGLAAFALRRLRQGQFWGMNRYQWTVGTFLGIPLARHLGRRPTFGIYFTLSGLSIMGAFGLDVGMPVRLLLFFLIGVTGFGALGTFCYYLPELLISGQGVLLFDNDLDDNGRPAQIFLRFDAPARNSHHTLFFGPP